MAAKRQADSIQITSTFTRVQSNECVSTDDIKPLYGRKWVTNGVNNVNFKTYKDADDSPTNSGIINCFYCMLMEVD
jgi:hypothetical protein